MKSLKDYENLMLFTNLETNLNFSDAMNFLNRDENGEIKNEFNLKCNEFIFQRKDKEYLSYRDSGVSEVTPVFQIFHKETDTRRKCTIRYTYEGSRDNRFISFCLGEDDTQLELLQNLIGMHCGTGWGDVAIRNDKIAILDEEYNRTDIEPSSIKVENSAFPKKSFFYDGLTKTLKLGDMDIENAKYWEFSPLNLKHYDPQGNVSLGVENPSQSPKFIIGKLDDIRVEIDPQGMIMKLSDGTETTSLKQHEITITESTNNFELKTYIDSGGVDVTRNGVGKSLSADGVEPIS